MHDLVCELPRILLLRSSPNREPEIPQRDPSAQEEVVVLSLLNAYILPSLANRGGELRDHSLPAPRSRRGGSHLMRRRVLLILATMGLGVLLLGGGVALADTIDGTSGPDDLVGTDKEDVIHGSGGQDYISGLAGPDVLYAGNDTAVGRDGNDRIYGNTGYDMLFGEGGNDTINSAGDREKDVVKCGRGAADTAYVDKIDWVKENCENVFLLVRAGSV
jgi:hypothetical protein